MSSDEALPQADVDAVAPVAPARPPRARALARGVWRWSKRITLALVVLIVVLRLALPYALPGLLASFGRGHGLAIQCGDVRFRFYRGEAWLTR